MILYHLCAILLFIQSVIHVPFLFLAKWSRPEYLISCVRRKSFDATTHPPGQYILHSTILLSGIPRTEQAIKGSELSFLVLDQSSNVLQNRICPAYYLNSPSLDAFVFLFFFYSEPHYFWWQLHAGGYDPLCQLFLFSLIRIKSFEFSGQPPLH